MPDQLPNQQAAMWAQTNLVEFDLFWIPFVGTGHLTGASLGVASESPAPRWSTLTSAADGDNFRAVGM